MELTDKYAINPETGLPEDQAPQEDLSSLNLDVTQPSGEAIKPEEVSFSEAPAAEQDISKPEELTPIGNGEAIPNPFHGKKVPSTEPTVDGKAALKEKLPTGESVFTDGTIVHPDGTVIQKHGGFMFMYPPGVSKPIIKPDPAEAQNNPDVQNIADAIVSGDQPPTLQGLYRHGMAVRAALAKRGYPLAQAQLDFEATKRHIATLNGQKQTSLMQSADNAFHGLDVVDELAKEWKGGNYPLLNKAALASAKAGTGDFSHLDEKSRLDAQRIATLLDAQIANLSTELANVNMGGGTPTDHAMELAAKELNSDWSENVLLHATQLARRNVQIRLNSMKNVGVIGASANNPYAPKTEVAPSPSPSAAPSATPAAPKFVVGKPYKDKSGAVKVYKGGDPLNPASWQ